MSHAKTMKVSRWEQIRLVFYEALSFVGWLGMLLTIGQKDIQWATYCLLLGWYGEWKVGQIRSGK